MRVKMLLAIATALALAAGASVLRAQGACQGQCDISFGRCKQACVDAQNFDDCLGDCRSDYEQCMAGCG